jgi:mannosyltransferase OCH1-like enzyme
MIPKIIHQIWLGDKSLKPTNLMKTWEKINPSWEYKLWTEENLPVLVNQKHFDNYGSNYVGKANILRYEILNQFGGFYIDADSKAIKPLDDSLLKCKAFACWENEKCRDGIISNGYFASEKNGYTVSKLINEINLFDEIIVKNISGWRVSGVMLLSNIYKQLEKVREELKVYPSHYFIPTHWSGLKYTGNDDVYCEQYWGNTLQKYEELKNYE